MVTFHCPQRTGRFPLRFPGEGWRQRDIESRGIAGLERNRTIFMTEPNHPSADGTSKYATAAVCALGPGESQCTA
jgi:hypothetical protein